MITGQSESYTLLETNLVHQQALRHWSSICEMSTSMFSKVAKSCYPAIALSVILLSGLITSSPSFFGYQLLFVLVSIICLELLLLLIHTEQDRHGYILVQLSIGAGLAFTTFLTIALTITTLAVFYPGFLSKNTQEVYSGVNGTQATSMNTIYKFSLRQISPSELNMNQLNASITSYQNSKKASEPEMNASPKISILYILDLMHG